jgi:hypothetical protein
MNVQVKRIASDDNFIRMYQNGVSRQDLANYFGVPYQTINQVVELHGIAAGKQKRPGSQPGRRQIQPGKPDAVSKSVRSG